MRLTYSILLTAVAFHASLHAQAPASRQVAPVVGQRRIALVVGNNEYPRMPLRNAVNDARSVHQLLQGLGFESTLVADASLRDLESAVSRFIASIQPGDAAMFYYSGHGIQIDGENYLIPISYAAADEAEVKYQAYPAGRIHDRMLNAGARLSVLVLDACRDNPFRSSKSDTKGLAVMTAGKGSFIVFATAPGSTASDQGAAAPNGLFTARLIAALGEPGLGIESLFSRVRKEVYEASGGRQLPWTGSSLIGDFIFNDPISRSEELHAEIARQEAELGALEEKNRQAAARLQTEAQSREEARKRSELEASLRRDNIEMENLKQAAERQRQLQMEREKLEQANAAREAENRAAEARLLRLRERAKEQQADGKKLEDGSMTLEQAQAEVERLERQIVEAQTEIAANRERELQKLQQDYQPLLALADVPLVKGEFETSAQFNERARKQKAEAAPVQKKYEDEQAAIKKRYQDELALRTGENSRRLVSLRSGTYTAPCNLEWGFYDADDGLLRLRSAGSANVFEISPEEARDLKGRLRDLSCRVPYSRPGVALQAERISSIVDAGTGREYRSVVVSPQRPVYQMIDNDPEAR